MMNNNNTRIRTNVTATAIRETEKAYQAEVKYWTSANQPVKVAKMWVPKSCCEAKDSHIVAIDEFILNKWEEDHRNLIKTHSGYAARKMRINWNLAEKEGILQKEADEKAAYKKFVTDTTNEWMPKCTAAAHDFMGALGSVAQAFGLLWKEEGKNAALCEQLIEWGMNVNKKYPYTTSLTEYYEKVKSWDAQTRDLVINWAYSTWVFGDMHVDYYGTTSERNFYKVNEGIMKKFKKEDALRKEFNELIDKIWQE